MPFKNPGYEPKEIQLLKDRMNKAGRNFLLIEEEENSSEYVNFRFVGKYEGKEVIYDAVLYTLRLHHESEIYEIAEHKAAQRFPEFRKIKYEEDENGDIRTLDDLDEEIGLYMTEVMMDLEEEESVKVQEYLELDDRVDYGVSINAAINVDDIDEKVVTKFVNDYNSDTLVLDDTFYSFQSEDEEMEL